MMRALRWYAFALERSRSDFPCKRQAAAMTAYVGCRRMLG